MFWIYEVMAQDGRVGRGKTVDMPPATDKVPPVTPWKWAMSSPEELTLVVGLGCAESCSCWMWCAAWRRRRYLAVNRRVRRRTA